MSVFREIQPDELSGNAIKMISKDWALVSAKREDKVNTMTISWGGLGFLWGKPVAFVFINPQRYTYDFVESAGGFSITFFDESLQQQLLYCGSVSGRDEDKISHMGFTVSQEQEVPYFEQARVVLVCKKIYVQDLEEGCIIDPSVLEQYPEKDFHRMYVGEIVKVLVRD